jgi:hypothetical protein
MFIVQPAINKRCNFSMKARRMANLDQIINFTKNYQDVELASAIGELKKNPGQLQRFLQSQQDHVYSDIVKQKDSTFQKVYGDLDRATKVQEAVLMYQKRTEDLSKIQQQVYDNQQTSATAVIQDKDLAGRKQEMNEWTVNNKNDTLFVMSSLFIMTSGLLLLTGLWRMGIISSYVWVFLGLPLIIIFIMIVVNRSQYTDNLRNKRYWNKQIFEGKYGKIPVPLCPNLVSDIQNLGTNIQSGARNVMQAGASGLASAATTTASELNAFSNTVTAASHSAATQ